MTIVQIASLFEQELARIYILVSGTAFVSAAGISALILIFLGFSAIPIIEAIGSWLFVAVISLAWLRSGKNRCFNHILSLLRNGGSSIDDLVAFVRQNAISFELAHNDLTSRFTPQKAPSSDNDSH